jgi:hypothetical protein
MPGIKKLKIVLISGFWILSLSSGCMPKADLLKEARDYGAQSREYYQRAVKGYKNLISKGDNPDKLHFELGKLYYGHGDFALARDEFRKTNETGANKFLAISYYRSANFTDALEIFNRQEEGDGEYLYYYGLTCEKLNLFDKALEVYRKIKDSALLSLASERINGIERQVKQRHIKDADSKISEIITNAPQAQDYPQAGALILYCDEKIEVTPQNTKVASLHYVIKILNPRGKEEFSEAHIDYDSTDEKVELEYARTIKPDGAVAEVGARHIRDVSKYLNFPLYSNARVFIISFPEVAEGSVIEYKARIYSSQLINKKDIVLGYPVQAPEPVIRANFTLTLPKEKKLFIRELNTDYNNFGAELKPRVSEKDGRLIYSWRFEDIPQVLPESNMPPQVEINPALLISTFSNWQDIYNWWWGLAKDKVKVNEAIKQKVKELTRGKPSDEAKLRAIYNFCAKEIRYVAVEYGQAGYEPHSAEDIFKNKYGDCKDQAILLVTMLKEAGLSAWPVLIGTREYYNLNEDFPAVLFNHCIAAVSLGGKVVFMDPTAETCSFGDLPGDDQDRKVLFFKENGYEIKMTPLYDGRHNLMKQGLKMKIAPDESIAAEKDIFTHGVYQQAQRYWLLYTPPELIRDALEEKIQGVSIGAKLDKYDIENLNDLDKPVTLRYKFKGPEYLTAAGNLRIMPQLAGLDTSLVAKDKRRYPLDFNVLDRKETIFEVEIPAMFIVKYMPSGIIEESPWLSYKTGYERHDNRIVFREYVELKKNRVLQSEYADFKKFVEGLAKKIKERIVLERAG